MLLALAVLAGLALTVPAWAVSYWTVPEVLKSFFADAKKVSFKRVSLSAETAKKIGNKLGTDPISREWTIYVAEGESGRRGFAVVDAEKGMHEPIDYAVQLSVTGTVQRIEILVYREAYGDEVRSERFRKQFRGKDAGDPIEAGEDIDIISGATISSRSVARGVKRDVLVLDALLRSGAL
jgi:Na+-translocating ferredoxin:NAD+ oxidoreductase RnfG subunit